MTQKQVKESLVSQLKANGADIEVFLGLISDYVTMYDVCEKLKKDIKKRGVIIDAVTARGLETSIPNPSIKELRDTSKSMLAILKQLGLSPDSVQSLDDDRL